MTALLEPAQFSALPALRCLGDLADVRPTIVIDTREQTPLSFRRLESVRRELLTGDYSFLGSEDTFAVERKTIADLTGCCTGSSRERFFRELHRLRGFRFKRLLVVGSLSDIEAHQYVSQVSPQAVLSTLGAIEARFDVPAVFSHPLRPKRPVKSKIGPIGSPASRPKP